jgi:DNA-binding NarL/FixJ family response regulator
MAEPPTRPVRTAIQSTRRLVREALAACLASRPEFSLVGQTATLEGLGALCELRRPDVALVDAGTVDGSVVESIRQVRDRFPTTRLVVAFTEMSRETMQMVGRAGVSALVPCSGGLDALLRALRQQAGSAPTGSKDGAALTERELAIVALLGAGHSVPQMAKLLNISPYTVENHKRHVYAKLGVGNQSHAVSRATALGLLDKPAPAAGQRHWTADRGETRLVVVHGPPSACVDRVVLALVDGDLPVVLARDLGELSLGRWAGSQPESLTTVLVDPTPEDWMVAESLGVPVVVVHSVPPDLASVADAMLRGARALIRGDDVAADLCPVLGLAAHGYFTMTAAGMADLVNWMSVHLGEPAPDVPVLTGRERDILRSISLGHTIRQTARSLGIAVKTVENTQARLFRKLGTRNRSETVTVAYQLGLIDPGMAADSEPGIS